MRRVFAIDVLQCPDCGGALRILAAIHPPSATRSQLPTRPPPVASARLAARDLHLDDDAC